MSRIGKKPISIPAGVTVSIDGPTVSVAGPKGALSRDIPRDIHIEIIGNEIVASPARNTKKAPALWGLSRALVANMVEGVTNGFEKKLEFEGIGYRMAVEESTLVMQIGFSHPVKIPAPEGVSFSLEKNVITISGINKELVGETAAYIRSIRPTEPYKGKGIRYQGEIVRRKAGKKAVASG
ncbi:MAG: 50S ribosomal protein L6 [Candidatus Sungbacteria bacterium RIFCSPHIGHO2_01_FULL_50_25]|uniref:Large ribosomal subunit protein uL6 n=1 Tax=Candidatus Sungbacteria bacterium RIFCSPHIGHO2_01_FULL_50_25 TaxID=1802265 RepID=A0A1G2K856_9BACT|nr:MAG: 50S ribosomal protein L6 [Candidatus Sungbacteria bacterium RIFCSPHIGHO2_01_FULL_50_25]